MLTEITVLLLMTLSGVITAFAYDHYTMVKMNRHDLEGLSTTRKELKTALESFQKLHNESAIEFKKLAKDVDDLKHKVSISDLFKPKR